MSNDKYQDTLDDDESGGLLDRTGSASHRHPDHTRVSKHIVYVCLGFSIFMNLVGLLYAIQHSKDILIPQPLYCEYSIPTDPSLPPIQTLFY